MVTVYDTQKKSLEESLSTHSTLSAPVSDFIKALSVAKSEKQKKSVSTVSVSDYLGGVARLYEKVRTTVEYKGEHVLRRNAIERILKRLLWSQGVLQTNIDAKHVTNQLIRELIWARYVENNRVPKSSLKHVETTIQKYSTCTRLLDTSASKISKSTREAWLIGIISSEIEDLLDPTYRELYIQLFYRWFRDRYTWKNSSLSEHDRALQIYLAIHRAYQRSDNAIMRYHLLMLEFPEWTTATPTNLEEFVTKFSELYTEIERHIQYESRLAIYRIVKRHVPAFEVLQMVATTHTKDFETILSDPAKLEASVRQMCETVYNETRSKVTRGIARSIVYIFVTKVVLALLLEIPYEILRYGDIRLIPVTINIVLPPFLMAAIGASIRTPGEKNTQSLVRKVEQIVYDSPIDRKIAFQVTKTRSTLNTIFGFLYAILAIGLFTAIGSLLIELHFTFIGIGIFFAFLSLVLLFAYRVKANANKLRVEPEKETILDSVTNFLTLPFLNMGMYLSKGLSVINIASIVLDFLIEAPLKSIIEVIEDWISFVKEKREEVINVPE